MDTSNLLKNHQKLMDFLVENGYMKDTIRHTRKCIGLALDAGVSPEIASYEELFFLEIKKLGYTSKDARYKNLKTYLGNVRQFDLQGIYPCGVGCKNGFLAPKPLYNQLNAIFRSAIDYHLAFGGKHGKQEMTLCVEARAAVKFFKHLQDSGAETFHDIENKMIYIFFFKDERQIRGRGYCSHVKAVLKAIIPLYGEQVQKILDMLPLIKSGKKNFQYLTEVESIKIRECLENEDSGLTHLERCIGWLLYFLGLRGTDITKLRFENIDWDHDQIHLVQSKTGEPLSLPINAAIGNELFDYIAKERPQSSLNTILLSKIQPYGELKRLEVVVNKIFKKASVRTDGGAKGLRVLRHHLVTYLLSHGVECDVVSSIVGHSAPESIKPYADADIEHLRECSISIDAYPITNKLFEI